MLRSLSICSPVRIPAPFDSGGGLMWLDSTCTDKYGKAYLDCTAKQKTEMLDCITYRKNAVEDASLSQGVAFFSFLRNLTADGFFTSKIGIQYLGYIGNGYLAEFPGCPQCQGFKICLLANDDGCPTSRSFFARCRIPPR